jgi:hypothetical protein
MTVASDIDLDSLDGRELVRLFGRVMLALRERDIVRSANNPIADIAEQLVAAHYGGKVAPPNEPSYDVLAADGRRLQVKALRRSQKGRTTLSPLRSHDFDAVVAVTFKPDLEVEAAFYIPLAVVEEYQRWSETWKAHRLSLTKRLCADDRVTRIDAGDLLGENDG